MSGIPVYTTAPLSAAKPVGITPQTHSPATSSTAARDSYTPATTTATATSRYPAARPGQSAPAPTGAAATRYAPATPTPTPTRTTDPSIPAPPQPGSHPMEQPSLRPMTPQRNNLPPPPKAGEHFTPPAHAAYYPPQMSLPAPSTNIYSPTSSTSTCATPSHPYPAALPFQSPAEGGSRRSLEHPPGYVQNSYAQVMSAEQRRASEAVAAGESTTSGAGMYNAPGWQGHGEKPKGAFGIDAESMWESFKGWGSVIGKKLEDTEAEVWKRVGGGK